MLEIKRAVVSLDENELIELERIITDNDTAEGFKFLKKSVYEKIMHAQQGRLKSHLDSGSPVEKFKSETTQ